MKSIVYNLLCVECFSLFFLLFYVFLDIIEKKLILRNTHFTLQNVEQKKKKIFNENRVNSMLKTKF